MHCTGAAPGVNGLGVLQTTQLVGCKKGFWGIKISYTWVLQLGLTLYRYRTETSNMAIVY